MNLPATVTSSALNDLFERFDASGQSLKPILAQDPRSQKLALLMADPKYQHMGFSRLCTEAGLTYQDLTDIVRDFTYNQMLLDNLPRMPEVLEHTHAAALNTQSRCSRCDGLKTVTRTVVIMGEEVSDKSPCPECDGTGKLMKPGDKNARRDFLDVMGVRGSKAAQLNVQINTGSQRLEDLITVASKVIEE